MERTAVSASVSKAARSEAAAPPNFMVSQVSSTPAKTVARGGGGTAPGECARPSNSGVVEFGKSPMRRCSSSRTIPERAVAKSAGTMPAAFLRSNFSSRMANFSGPAGTPGRDHRRQRAAPSQINSPKSTSPRAITATHQSHGVPGSTKGGGGSAIFSISGKGSTKM